MAKKPAVTSEVEETPEVIITEQAPAEEVRPLSAQTLAEMEAGREALRQHAANARPAAVEE